MQIDSMVLKRVHSNGMTTEISDRWASWIVLRDWIEELVQCMGP
jgi:hypothetical protein